MMGEEWRRSYREGWEIYDKFSKYEDFEDKVWRRLLEIVDFKNKVIFEMGCGTGKYTQKMAQIANKVYANDISSQMIRVAKKKCSAKKNVEYICASAEKSGLPDHCVDYVFSAWGYCANDDKFAQKLNTEFKRILKPGGSIWLLDNYYDGEFTIIRNKRINFMEPLYSEWKYGYELVDVVKTEFVFPNVEEAAKVFSYLFGETAASYIRKKDKSIITDKVAILRME